MVIDAPRHFVVYGYDNESPLQDYLLKRFYQQASRMELVKQSDEDFQKEWKASLAQYEVKEEDIAYIKKRYEEQLYLLKRDATDPGAREEAEKKLIKERDKALNALKRDDEAIARVQKHYEECLAFRKRFPNDPDWKRIAEKAKALDHFREDNFRVLLEGEPAVVTEMEKRIAPKKLHGGLSHAVKDGKLYITEYEVDAQGQLTGKSIEKTPPREPSKSGLSNRILYAKSYEAIEMFSLFHRQLGLGVDLKEPYTPEQHKKHSIRSFPLEAFHLQDDKGKEITEADYRAAYEKGIDGILEKEKRRSVLVKAVKQSKEYEALSTPEAKKDLLALRIMETYNFVLHPNNHNIAINDYGTVAVINAAIFKQLERNEKEGAKAPAAPANENLGVFEAPSFPVKPVLGRKGMGPP